MMNKKTWLPNHHETETNSNPSATVAELRLKAEQSIQQAKISIPSTKQNNSLFAPTKLSANFPVDNQCMDEKCEGGTWQFQQKEEGKSKLEELRLKAEENIKLAQASKSKYLDLQLPNSSRLCLEAEVIPLSQRRLLVEKCIQTAQANGPSAHQNLVAIKNILPSVPSHHTGLTTERSLQPQVSSTEINYSNIQKLSTAAKIATTTETYSPELPPRRSSIQATERNSPSPQTDFKSERLPQPRVSRTEKNCTNIQNFQTASEIATTSSSHPPELPPRRLRITQKLKTQEKHNQPMHSYVNIVDVLDDLKKLPNFSRLRQEDGNEIDNTRKIEAEVISVSKRRLLVEKNIQAAQANSPSAHQRFVDIRDSLTFASSYQTERLPEPQVPIREINWDDIQNFRTASDISTTSVSYPPELPPRRFGIPQKLQTQEGHRQLNHKYVNIVEILDDLPSSSRPLQEQQDNDKTDITQKTDTEVLPVSKLRLLLEKNIQAAQANGPPVRQEFAAIKNTSPSVSSHQTVFKSERSPQSPSEIVTTLASHPPQLPPRCSRISQKLQTQEQHRQSHPNHEYVNMAKVLGDWEKLSNSSRFPQEPRNVDEVNNAQKIELPPRRSRILQELGNQKGHPQSLLKHTYVNIVEVLEELELPPPLPPRSLINKEAATKIQKPMEVSNFATSPRNRRNWSPPAPELPPRRPRVIKKVQDQKEHRKSRPKSTYLNVFEDGLANMIQGFTSLSKSINKSKLRSPLISPGRHSLVVDDSPSKFETVNSFVNIGPKFEAKTLPKEYIFKMNTPPPLPSRPFKYNQEKSKPKITEDVNSKNTTSEAEGCVINIEDTENTLTQRDLEEKSFNSKFNRNISKLQIDDNFKMKISETIKLLNRSPQFKSGSTSQENENEKQQFLFHNENKIVAMQRPNDNSRLSKNRDSGISRSSYESVDEENDERNSTLYDILDNYGDFLEEGIYDDVYEEKSDFSDNEVETESDKLSNIIKELITTERKFIKLLETIMKYKLLVKERYHNVPAEVIPDLFGNVEELVEASKEFLKLLEPRTKLPNVSRVAFAFIHSETMLELYTVYARNKPTSSACYDKYKTVITKIQKEINDPIGLSVHLLEPIQRPARYILFLDRIKGELKKSNCKTTTIDSALNKLKTSVRNSNDLLAIDSIKFSHIDLASQGSVIMRQEFQIIEPLPLDTIAFLFEKVIVFAINDSSSGQENLAYLKHIFLKNLKLNPLNHEILKFEFTDYSNFKKRDTYQTFTMQAKNQNDKKQWIDIIEKLLWEEFHKIRDSKRQMQKSHVFSDEAEVYIRSRRPLHLVTREFDK